MFASSLDPQIGKIESLLVIRRDDLGTAVSRLVADSAVWKEADQAWILEGGREMDIVGGEYELAERRAVETWSTDLSPRMLLARTARLRPHELTTLTRAISLAEQARAREQ